VGLVGLMIFGWGWGLVGFGGVWWGLVGFGGGFSGGLGGKVAD